MTNQTSTSVDKTKKLEEKIAAHEQKIAKLETQLSKKRAAFEKLINSYKNDVEICNIIPFDVFNNFKYITYSEQRAIAAELGLNSLIFPYNYVCGKMYYDKGDEIRARYGITKNTPYNGNEAKYRAADSDPDTRTLHRFYWDYFTKAETIIEEIAKKEKTINELKGKIISINDNITAVKANKQRETDLFEQVPELAEFIEAVGEKQYKFYVEQNEKLKIAWAKYDEALKKLNDKYGDKYQAKHNAHNDNGESYNKYVELNKTKPKNMVRTDEYIKLLVAEWKIGERAMLASRITTEFGKINYTKLYISEKDGNVNGVISGTNKTATIETIYAGGYNIQCFHTRILIHEK